MAVTCAGAWKQTVADLRGRVVAQGPGCAAALGGLGAPVSITPEHGHMGALVLAIARHFEHQPLFGGRVGSRAGAGRNTSR